MIHSGFTWNANDCCAYHNKLIDYSFVYLLLYVDDMLIDTKRMSQIDFLKKQLGEELEMKDLGATKKILGMEITLDRSVVKLMLSQ